MRVGLGFDLHRLKTKKGCFILMGGVRVASGFEVVAHSDGDVLLHALSDALLSALGLADIGVLFPPGANSTKNMDSRRILKRVLDELKKRKKKIKNISCVVAVEKPSLSPYRDQIRGALSQALNLRRENVGLTFKSFENLPGMADKAVACWASCLI